MMNVLVHALSSPSLLVMCAQWTIAEQLTDAPVRCDEFEPGRKSYVMNMPMGVANSGERLKFQVAVYWPAILGTCFMKSYRDMPAASKLGVV